MKKKSQVTIYVAYLFTAFIILAITAVVAPAGTLFTARAIEAGEDILIRANDSIQNIQNETIKAGVTDTINSAFSAGDMNIEVTSDLFQYSWVIMIALVGIVAFLYTRQIVEFQGGGGFV